MLLLKLYESKGHEYDIVILFDFTDKSYFKDFDPVADNNNWYVGHQGQKKNYLYFTEYNRQLENIDLYQKICMVLIIV